MERTLIKDIKSHVGEEVKICGFTQIIRNQGKIAFLIVRDVSGEIQTVVLKNTEDAFSKISELTMESVVEIVGKAKEEKQAPSGYEVEASHLKILSKAASQLPIPVMVEKGGEDSDVTKRFDYRWLDLRKKDKKDIFKYWTAMEKGFRNYFYANDFTQIYAPSIMNSPSESGAEVFEVKYFDTKKYLAQSPQFYKQLAMCAGLEKVFIVGPIFRAEPSFTTRHMTEFTGWDFEISYVESHHDVMQTLEKAVISGFTEVKSSLLPDLEVPAENFPKISMLDAKKKLKEAGIKSEKEFDVSPEEERVLGDMMKKEFGHDFFFLIDYPIQVRPFYHMRHEDNPLLTKSFDLIYKGLEITTGAQREHRVDVLEKQALEKGMTLEEIGYYIDFFRNGCPPHGGVGMGPGRIIMKLLDLSSVKEATFLPRDVKRTNP